MLRGKDQLRHHHVNTVIAVDKLSNVKISGDAGQHVRIVAAQLLLLHEKFNHFANCELGRFVQICIQPHRDVICGCFRTGPTPVNILTDNKLKSADQRSLHGGDIYLPVPLPCVTVAYLKQSSAYMNREIKRSAGNQLFVVEVSPMHPRWVAAYAPSHLWWGHAHTPEKWPQRNFDSVG